MAANGGVHGAAVLAQVPHHDAAVDAGEGVVLELGGELLVGEVVFRRDEEAGGVPVDAVDDAGPSSPPMPDRLSPQWWSRAFTSVPSGWPGAGWTTSPLGLFTTMTSASSYTTSRGMSWGATSTAAGSGRVTATASPPVRR